MTWTRASELHRSLHCPASTVLGRKPDEGGAAASFGTAVHAWVSGAEPSPAVADWIARQPVNPATVRNVFWPGGMHDVLLAVPTGDAVADWKMLAGDRDWRQQVRAGLDQKWVAGEADWVSLDGPIPHVDDLKTGWDPGPPHIVDQLWLYALVIQAVTEAPAVQISITHWPADGKQPPIRSGKILGANDLDHWYGRTLVPAARLATGPSPPTIPGDWCRFCPCTACTYNYDANQGAEG